MTHKKAPPGWATSPSRSLRAGSGGTCLADLDAASTPGFSGGKSEAASLLETRGRYLNELQEMLYANAVSGQGRSVLLVLQGMDTAGKGGIIRHVLGLVNPEGIDHAPFGVPTAEERQHHFFGVPTKHYRDSGTSACSIALITRMSSSRGCIASFPKQYGRRATGRSTISNASWQIKER